MTDALIRPPLCHICGREHWGWEGHDAASRMAAIDAAEPVPTVSMPALAPDPPPIAAEPVPVPTPLPARTKPKGRDRERYRAYMKDYMAKRRAAAKKGKP